MISFEGTKTNHYKLPRKNNTESNNNASNYIPHNLHKLSSCDLENNSREFGTLNAVCEEIIKLHIFIESRQENFKKGAHS